jgi:hypothetical protein
VKLAALLCLALSLLLAGCETAASRAQAAETKELVRLIMNYDRDGDWSVVRQRLVAAKVSSKASRDLFVLAGIMETLPEVRRENEAKLNERLLAAVKLARKLDPDFVG